MDAKELRSILEQRLAASKDVSRASMNRMDARLTLSGKESFYRWWFYSHLSEAERREKHKTSTYITDMMLQLTDEELMFLWAVYCM